MINIPTPRSLQPVAPHPRAAFWLAVNLATATLLIGVFALFLGLQAGSRPILSEAGLLLSMGLAAVASAWLIRQGRFTLGASLLLAQLLVIALGTQFLFAGLGVLLGVVSLIGAALVASLALYRRRSRRVILAGAAGGLLTILLDQMLYLPGFFERQMLPEEIRSAIPVVIGVMLIGYAIFMAQRFANYTLRTKLILTFLFVGLIPLSVLAFLNDLATRRTLTEAANQSLLTAASQTADRLDSFITSASRMVQIEALLPAFQDYLNLPADRRAGSAAEREANALLQILSNKDPLLSYLLLDRRGQVVAATSGEALGQGKADQDYFRVPFGRLPAEPFSSPVDFSDNPATGNLYFTQAVVDAATADALGVLVARYDAAILQSLVVRSNDLAGPRSFGVLFDENHLQLAHGVAPHTLYKFAGSMPAERVAELQSDQRLPVGPAEGFSLNLAALENGLNNALNQKFFTAQEAAVPVGQNRTDQVAAVSLKTRPWLVAFFEPRAAFLAPAEEQSRNTLVFAVLMAGVMSMAALGVAQVLAGPIARLTQVAERITAGDLNAQANPEGGDEIGALAVAFNTMTTRLRDLIGSLETRVTERTAQLQAAADIGRATASVRDLSQLMTLALELIRERFGFYHASIFLLDEAGEFAVVRESAGPLAAELKARGHKLGVGSNSLIGWVTQHRHPRVALDVAEDPFHFKNPLLPDTRSELAIPLIVGDRLLGALDVQSTTPDAFSESDVQVLQTLADQLSVAIENAGLFQRTQASLDELSALYRQVTDPGWQALVQGQPHEMVFELEPLTRMPTSVEISTSVSVPLELRGQTVGMIELHGRRQDALAPEERTVIEAVAAQLSVALESAVLLAETQRRSRREQLINDITFQMRSTLNPTIILQSGIRELGKALGATEVVVRLEQPDVPKGQAKPDQNPALPAE